MRTALRTAVATALVAGVALTTPALAAGAAFAAVGPVAAHPVLPGTVKVAGPGTGSPKAGTVEVEGPSTGAPKAEAPKTEVPRPEVPDTEAPKTEAPKTKAPKTEAPDVAPAPGPVVTVGECSVRQDVPSVFALMTVTLTRDLEKGPKAVLKDEAGKPVATVDRAHPADTGMGLTLKGADTVTPQLGQRTQGGDTPYAWTAFPKLPKGCEKDATPAPGPVVTVGECSVRQDVPSVFALMTVTLTRDLEKGPKAVLKDEAGKPVATVDRAHPADTGMGLTLKGADTVTPQLGQRTQGGDTPYAWTAFPKLPKGCEKDATPTPAPSVTTPASSGGTGITVNNGGQTSVVPKGGVAAGAEFAAEGDSTALIAVGAGAASLAAAGLGFVVLRRRAAGRV
ncbi:hypothetical protein [Streptomyces sp. NPDC002185]|uniref:hypothetical protein n=1 Tax=Streptomyces sp. NPDC002185 TaxID=3364636 RepID=UPI0036CC10AA